MMLIQENGSSKEENYDLEARQKYPGDRFCIDEEEMWPSKM